VRKASGLILALVVLAGCGGGGSSKALTKQEYASKADAICSKYNQKIKALGNPKSISDLADVADKTLPLIESAIGEFKKLKPPAAEQSTASQWIVQVQGLETDLKEVRDKAKAKDLPGVQAVLPRAQQHNARSNLLATQLGMSVCNSG
jgi:hypothetical protein